jgi:hypothetical protein
MNSGSFRFVISNGHNYVWIDMILAEDISGEEWAEWYRLTPLDRWNESQKPWSLYLQLGGSLDPEPDTQSPFYSPEEWRSFSSHEEQTTGVNS